MVFTNRWTVFSPLIGVMLATIVCVALVQEPVAAVKQKTFASANAAVQAAIKATKSGNQNELIAIFGPAGKGLLLSGDAVADRNRRQKFLTAYNQKHSLAPGMGGKVLVVGTNDWPFPIPVVKKGNVWRFDTNKGRQEILNRRIGQNELDAIQVCLAIVDAQREYAMSQQSDGGFREYAQKFRSDPGQKNGLYWATSEGETPSPLGPFAAQATKEGYDVTQPSAKPQPYRGYYYRMLRSQGKHAPEGAMDYAVDGHMIFGFAVVAYPAQYGNSGVMTFIVNHDGLVYQKDLGPNTAKLAQAMKAYDPDPSWKKAK